MPKLRDYLSEEKTIKIDYIKMKPEIFNTIPYVGRRELLELRDLINSIIQSSENILLKQPNEESLYLITDYTGGYSFSVTFAGFEVSASRNKYKVIFNPQNETSLKQYITDTILVGVAKNLNHWIDLIKKMQEITEQYYNPFGQFYEEQFSEFFTNNDSDNETNPYEIEKQQIIYQFLEYAKKRIELSPDLEQPEKEKLAEEISTLQTELPKTVKKQFAKNLSKFAQGVMKASDKAFHEVFDVLKKEVIKKVLYEGWHKLPEHFHKIDDWLNLLS